MQRTRRSVSEKQRLLAEYQASGLTIAAFCAREGLNLSTFYNWKQKASAAGVGPRLARLVVSRGEGAQRQQHCSTAVVVEVAGLKIHCAAGFDRGALAGVLGVLEERR